MYKKLLSGLILYICLHVLAFAGQDGVSLQGSVDKRTITIGDVINYTLVFTHPENLKLVEPEKPNEMGQWSVRDVQHNKETKEAKAVDRLNYSLTTFTTGEVLIPEIAFIFRDQNSKDTEIKAQPFKIKVESVLQKYGNSGTIRDIKPPLNLRYPLYVYMLWLVAISLLIAAAAFWYSIYKKRSIYLPGETPCPKRPPYEIAMEELIKLKDSGLIKEGRIKEFYIALSDIIRDFISAVYSIETRDRTTVEIYSDLRKNESDKKILTFIRDFFDECDLVKFAKYRPDEKACEQDWEAAKTIINFKLQISK